jgi:hypothetical protein
VKGKVPIATVGRTLLDLAAIHNLEAVERIADAAFRNTAISPARLRTYLEAKPPLPGLAMLKAIATDRALGGILESDLETRGIQILRSFGLPAPKRQCKVVANGRSVRFDLGYPEHGFAIEFDGRTSHYGRERWQSDHDRHYATELAGIPTLRFTDFDVNERPLSR